MLHSEKVVIVTGGSTGIGRAIAGRLAQEGARVVITGRHRATLESAAALHDGISYVIADVAQPRDVTATVDAIIERYGRLDVLVNNAGIAPFVPVVETTLEHFDHVMAVNLRGAVDMVRQSLDLLRKSRGNIVNIGSLQAEQPSPMLATYAASKAALTAYTKSWAKELAIHGIRVNIVQSGPIETPVYNKTGLSSDKMSQIKAGIAAAVPLKRLGQPEEIAAVVSFLASEQASYITGAEYPVGGGYGI